MTQTTVKHDKTPLFSWADLGTEQGAAKALKQITAIFARAGNKTMQEDEKAASAEISKVKRTNGVKYREIAIAFLDGISSVILRIKETGDIYQVILNKKLTPIKNQDDHKKAIDEIISLLNANRPKLQAAMAKKKDPTPRTKTSTSKKQQIIQLTERRDQLVEDIATIEEETAKLAA